MDLELTAEQKQIRDLARKFAEEVIAPQARENDIQERFHRDVLAGLAELGMLGGVVPEEYGGSGMGYVSLALMTEEIGRVDSSVRSTLSVQISLVESTLLQWGTEEQKRRYLPELSQGRMIGCFGLTEPEAGSDAANQQTSARRDGSAWVLNGAKTWITNGGVSDLALIFAQTDKEHQHKGIACFLVETDTPGFSTEDIKGKLGLRSSNTAQLFLEDARVPEENVLGKVREGFKIAMSGLDNGRFSVAAGAVGVAQACIDASVRHARERKTFGKPIGAHQLIQEMIAEMVVETEAARLLVWKAALLKDQGRPNTRETSIAKYYASEVAMRAALNAVQIYGGYGYSNEYPVERFMRDAKVNTLYEGTSQIQKLIIASHELGLRAFD